MPYGDLTEAEQAHWNEYENLRGISDWTGFTEAQESRKQAARDWLVQQRKEIWRAAEGKTDDVQAGWNRNKRQARYDFLSDPSLNSGAPKHEVTLPCPPSATKTERVYIEEREVYLAFAATTNEQKARKTANVDWLVERRKQLYTLMQDSSDAENKANGRSDRYRALCIATHHGDAYEQWADTHNKWGKAYTEDGVETSTGGVQTRSWFKAHCRSYLRISESPPGSNRGAPQPDEWQRRVYGGTGVPWCACFTTCMVQDAGIDGAGSAGVAVCVSMAKRGQGIFRGWTTDPRRVHAGDLAVISCTSCHIGAVVEAPYGCVEGNTSPGSEGSQFNGGCVAERQRKGAIVGWCLVRWPD
jgi:hypothetical protein